MRFILICFLLSSTSLLAVAQPNLQSLFFGFSRIDDFQMNNNGTGYLAVNGVSAVLKTIDGGITYSPVLNFNDSSGPRPYVRSIRFFNDSIGFLGTLAPNRTFWRTLDGGQNWENMSTTLPLGIAAICGMAVVDQRLLFATGRYFGDAYLLRSVDTGRTWVYTDMKPQASQLIDVHFIDSLNGFLTGKSANASEGAIVLRTADGGNSWTTAAVSNRPGDQGWKFFKRSTTDYYVSLENGLEVPNAYLRSYDAGQTWQLITMDTFALPMLQSVGFLTREIGFAGGHFSGILYTTDGGTTWTRTQQYSGFNRMQHLGDRLFISGNQFVYSGPALGVGVKEIALASSQKRHALLPAYPNPAQGSVTAGFKLADAGNAGFLISDMQGKSIRAYPPLYLLAGEHQQQLDLQGLAAGMYLLQLYTDDEHHFQRLLIK
ncbi:MAG: T9SS type A sorting domain-containing protein [Sphingobacteriaceae bacterium]|nr:T9SS type A sorting domain-containing protein [Sphingobacteriaceae bacterium]